jgi:hypothetical protein
MSKARKPTGNFSLRHSSFVLDSTLGIRPSTFTFPAAAPLRGWLAGTWRALFCAVAIFMLARRLAGALSPLDSLGLAICGLCIVGAAVAARAGRRSLWSSAFVSAATLVLGIAMSLPGTGAAGLLVFWALLLFEEGWTWTPLLRHPHRLLPAARPAQHLPSPADDSVLQQLTLRNADGVAELSGWLRMPLESGQRSGNLHVAFCPPFDCVPEIEIEQLEGPPARIKAAQVLPYGARLEVKLAEASEKAGSIALRFSALASRAPRGRQLH